MLQIDHLTMTHRKDMRTILEDFSIALNPGDKAVIVGEEGNGKSSLLKWIYDPALVEDYIDARGTRSTRGEVLAYLPQELPAVDRETTVADYFHQQEGFWDRSPEDLRRLAGRLGMDRNFYDSDQTLGTLSGGERVKVQMARLLLAQPDVLLLDEPTNDVDIETLEWMEELIRDHPGIALFISHDETLIEATANRVILLEQLSRKKTCRHTVANMPFRQFMEERAAGIARQAQLHRSERREEREARERFQRIQQSVEHAQRAVSRQDPHSGRLLKKKMASVKATEKRYAREHERMTEYPKFETAIQTRFERPLPLPAGKVVLDYAQPALHAPDGTVLARDVHLSVKGPEKVGIVGRNGAGKSTLLREVRDLLLPRRDLHVCYMPQDYGELLPMDLSPVAFLAPSGRKEDVTLVRTYLGSLKYTTAEMERPIRELSGGQKAKVLLLRMTLAETDVLLLDEPTRNFSPLSGPEIRALLRSFPGAVIAVSHDRKFLSEVCDRVLRLTSEGLTEAFDAVSRG